MVELIIGLLIGLIIGHWRGYCTGFDYGKRFRRKVRVDVPYHPNHKCSVVPIHDDSPGKVLDVES